MSKERLEQEIAQAVDSMNRAAAKLGEKDTALNAANSSIADLRAQLEAAKAAGGADAATLDSFASALDAAQTNLDAAVSANTEAVQAVTDAGAAASNVDTSAVTDAPAGDQASTDQPQG